MTDQTAANYGREAGPKQKLGVLAILSESFSLLFRNILLLGGIMFLVLLASTLPYILIYGSFGEYLSVASRGFGGMSWTVTIVNIVLSVVIYGGLISLLSQLVYDLRSGKRAGLMSYLARTPGHMLPITLLAIVGFFLAIIPIAILGAFTSAMPLMLAGGGSGLTIVLSLILTPIGLVVFLYVLAMFSVTNPAIAVDGAGFRGLGQSYGRTKGYRWSIIGVFALFFLILAVVLGGIGAVIGFASTNMLQALGTGQITTAVMVFQGINMLASAVITPLICIIPVVIFARLKEIKEGHGFGDVGSVFE